MQVQERRGTRRPRSPQLLEATSARRRRALLRDLCSDTLSGLETIVAAPDDTDPECLCEIAAARADALRFRLAIGRSSGTLALDASEDELEEPRCYLHDTTLQILEYLATGGFGFCIDVATIHEVAARAADDLRRWLDVIPDPSKIATLAPILQELAEEAERLGSPKVRTTICRALPELSTGVVVALSGAVRESLTNVRKHAGASEVRLIATATRGGVVVIVADDGCGIAAGASEGLGLPNSVFNRLRRVGAEGRVFSDQDGTQVRIAIPVAS